MDILFDDEDQDFLATVCGVVHKMQFLTLKYQVLNFIVCYPGLLKFLFLTNKKAKKL